MQLFALTIENEIVAASQAYKKQEYSCMECGKPVRLRGGEHRQDHFYHLKPDPACRQSQKSLTHLQVQWYLLNLLKGEDVRLERRFPEVSRIADVVWEDQKLVFEVQCSPISQIEVEERNRDYGSLGYRVVWILHERRFLKRNVTAAELWLQEHPHYFTNFNAEGEGEIYDQLHLIDKGLRVFSTPKSSVDLASPLIGNQEVVFKGDWNARSVAEDQDAVSVWEEFLKRRKLLQTPKSLRLWIEVKRWYLNILNLALQSLSSMPDRGPR